MPEPPSSKDRQQAGAETERTPVVIVSGLSGSGKTTALKALEDIGYEAVDNLPISLLPRLLTTREDRVDDQAVRSLAIGIDCRTRAFEADETIKQLDRLRRRKDLSLTLLFLECDDEVLTKRFSETRRRHPLALDRPVTDGIIRERSLMGPIRDVADFIFDTTGHSPSDLRRRLRQQFHRDNESELSITVMSFAFSRGVPREADLICDVRFLRNPHYVEELRDLTGLDERVSAYVAEDPDFSAFLDKVVDFILFLLPRYDAEGKSYLTIGFGCTGGQHRSVSFAELVGHILQSKDYPVSIVHRDARERLESAIGDTESDKK